MNESKRAGLVVRYLWEHRGAAAYGALCLGTFALVGHLMGAPLEGMLYAAALMLAVGLTMTVVGLVGCWRRHAQMRLLLRSGLPPQVDLPAARRLTERDWRALTQEALRQRDALREETERQARERDEYAALWTHQIKVPISAIRLLNQSDPQSHSPALSAELLKIEQYVDMQLGYARLSGPSTDYVLRTCALDAVIRRTVRRFAPLFIQKKLSLTYEGTKLSVLTDEKWLGFALEQLLSNAVKYTVRGGVTLAVDENAKTLTLSDTGIGIAPQDLPRVFEHGFTGANGREDKRATGLGLYLTRKTLDRLGHGIAIASEVGKGTTVTLRFDAQRLELE